MVPMLIVLSALIGLLFGMLLMYLGTVRGRRIPSLTKYVAFSIGFLICYTITELILATVSGSTHDTLTSCVFACFGGEILSCALIKIFKLKKKEGDNE